MKAMDLLKKFKADLEGGEPTAAAKTPKVTLPAWRFLPLNKTTIELAGTTFRLRKATRRDLVFRPVRKGKKNAARS